MNAHPPTKREAGELRSRAAGLEVRAEQLHKDNLELEASLSDRFFRNQNDAIKALEQFRGTQASIKFPDDRECRSTAEQINLVLWEAKWKVVGLVSSEPFSDGVGVSVGVKELIGSTDTSTLRALMSARSRADDIAQALISQLVPNGIYAHESAPDIEAKVGALVISVGPKPNPLVRRLLKSPRPVGGGGRSVPKIISTNRFFVSDYLACHASHQTTRNR